MLITNNKDIAHIRAIFIVNITLVIPLSFVSKSTILTPTVITNKYGKLLSEFSRLPHLSLSAKILMLLSV